jgi:hypothetical protein
LSRPVAGRSPARDLGRRQGRGHTGRVTFSLDSWRESVARAALADDEDALRRLFTEGRAALGEAVGVEWASALSGLDGTAVTG